MYTTAQPFFHTLRSFLPFFLNLNIFGTWSPIIASSYSRFNPCQWKKATEMLVASKLHNLLAVQLNLLHMLIPESPDCKTVHCNISGTLQSLFAHGNNSPETGQFWTSVLLVYIKGSYLIKFKPFSSLQNRKAQPCPLYRSDIQTSDTHDLYISTK